jgi:hypothetical protein
VRERIREGGWQPGRACAMFWCSGQRVVGGAGHVSAHGMLTNSALV